jgi:hypothetical protein
MPENSYDDNYRDGYQQQDHAQQARQKDTSSQETPKAPVPPPEFHVYHLVTLSVLIFGLVTGTLQAIYVACVMAAAFVGSPVLKPLLLLLKEWFKDLIK